MIRTQNCDLNRTTALAPSVPNSTATSGSCPIGSSREQPVAVAATTFPDSEVGASTPQAQKPGVSLGRFPSLSCSGSWEEKKMKQENSCRNSKEGARLAGSAVASGTWEPGSLYPLSHAGLISPQRTHVGPQGSVVTTSTHLTPGGQPSPQAKSVADLVSDHFSIIHFSSSVRKDRQCPGCPHRGNRWY